MKKIFIISAIIFFILPVFIICSCKKDESSNNTPTDIDGNVYKTITIGSQLWMAENLITTKYRNGDLIETTIPATKDISGESSPKYQWAYGGDETKVATYGRLYTWFAVTDIRNVCPAGWHLPSDAEWTTLTTYLGYEPSAGGKLKEAGITHWVSPNTGATNEAGFTALPGGYRYSSGTFDYIGYYGFWWSSTVFSSTNAYFRYMPYSFSYVSRNYFNRKFGFSVRCLQD